MVKRVRKKRRVIQLVVGGDIDGAVCYSNLRDLVLDNPGLRGMYGRIQRGLYKGRGFTGVKKYSINGIDIRRYEIKEV